MLVAGPQPDEGLPKRRFLQERQPVDLRLLFFKEAFMRIAVIGAGSVGRTLGQAWLKHGEDVTWGLRNPSDPKYAALPKERSKVPADAVKQAEIVVIACPCRKFYPVGVRRRIG
jgi:ketol-acid reductoisomerase